MEIVDAGIEKKKTAFVTVRFTADETYVIENAEGDIIAGHPDRVTEMTDKWTFTRDVKSSDPRWFLSKTEDDEIEEDGKTPIPDAG
jgi:predicted lipid-binding transport protein (Tim44 family)